MKLWYAIDNFFHWIIKSIQYSWLLRKDFDWDSSYILILLRYKLQRTEKRIRENNHIGSAKRVSKQINYAIFLLDRILKGDFEYFPKEIRALEEKWGQVKMVFGKDNSITFIYPLATGEEHEQATNEWFALHEKQYEEEQKDYARLFNHLNLYIQRWWD